MRSNKLKSENKIGDFSFTNKLTQLTKFEMFSAELSPFFTLQYWKTKWENLLKNKNTKVKQKTQNSKKKNQNKQKHK